MMKTKSYFQEYKTQQKNQLAKQLKIYETEDRLWVERSGYEHSYTFLETETNKFEACHDELEACMIVRVQNQEVREDLIEFHFKQGEKFSIITAQCDYVEEGVIYLYGTTMHVDIQNTNWDMTEEEKDTLTYLYRNFRSLLRDIPAYRLYFTTMKIEMDEEGVNEWLNGL